MSVDWLARAKGYIASGEFPYALWALSAALGQFRKADDLDGLKRVLEVAEGLKPSLQDRRSIEHCNLVAGGARQQIRFLTYFDEIRKLGELRDTGVISDDEFNKKKAAIPDWRHRDGRFVGPGLADGVQEGEPGSGSHGTE
jgi:hypothetical protein